MKPLLILVDLQNDYLVSPKLEPAAGVVVSGAKNLLTCCHECGIPVAHVWTTVSRDQDNRMPHWKEADIWRCERGTPGHRPPVWLAPLDGEPIVHKAGFSATKIVDLARRLSADTVIVAGVKTHACVRQVALDAWQAGLTVLVAADAIASDDPLHAAITRRYLEVRGVEFLANGELADRLNGGRARFVPDGRSRCASAAAAAHGFFATWRRTSIAERADCVRRLASVLASEIESLATLIAEEIGKPARFGRQEGNNSLEMLSRVLLRVEHEEKPERHPEYDFKRRPHGAIAAITPWNNPLYLPLGKIVPAILYGNTVVWKPAPEALMISRRLFQCFSMASWPEGLVTLVEGGEREASGLMIEATIGAVTITGSSAAGYAAQEICARRRIPLQAELGGNNTAIIWPDADLELAARQVAFGAFAMAGQRCTANRRVIVHVDCYHDFMRLLTQESAALKWGDPRESDTDIGPLISIAHRDRVAAAVEWAMTEGGAPLRPLGDTPQICQPHERTFYPPTIIRCDDPAREIVQDETFGPVLVVQTARDFEEAMLLCNGVRQGLAAAIFTASHGIARRFLDEAEAGVLKVNQSTAGAAIDAPFGGWKASGLGMPEHGRFDLEFFTRPQTVYGEVV